MLCCAALQQVSVTVASTSRSTPPERSRGSAEGSGPVKAVSHCAFQNLLLNATLKDQARSQQWLATVQHFGMSLGFCFWYFPGFPV